MALDEYLLDESTVWRFSGERLAESESIFLAEDYKDIILKNFSSLDLNVLEELGKNMIKSSVY